MGSFVTTYDGEYLHKLDARATKLQQALETDIYIYIYSFYENKYQAYVALFKPVVSVKEIYKSLFNIYESRGKV